MKKATKFLAVAVSSMLAFSSLAMFAACGESGGSDAPLVSRICFDNIDDNISVPKSATQIKLSGVASITEYDASGREAEKGSVAEWSGGVLKAVGLGDVVATLEDGSKVRVNVAPAYPIDPNNQYAGNSSDSSLGGNLLGTTHDPSLIEVEENGKPAYYIFSTGWEGGNDIHRSDDLIHWTYLGKATSSSTPIPEIEAWEEEKYATLSWWAPDIVPAADGGYWLYTCVVSGSRHQGSFGSLSKACIVLFHSDSLAVGSFQYKGVLMQSAIPGSGEENRININSIDPQIIYDTAGKMYMAYGSFGTGNWMLELDPETGLRADGKYADGKFLTAEEVRAHRNKVVADGYDDKYYLEDKYEHEYYGRLISVGNMEAPVIARHDGVTVMDENGKVIEKDKTFYYSMHSYNGLDEAYQMWGGRSESVWGTYRSALGSAASQGVVSNSSPGSSSNSGNKYMGRFVWDDKTSTNIDIILPGHNDLFTNSVGTNLAAYITRSPAFGGAKGGHCSQIHQYYLNSMGDIVINPNRYGGEVNREVSSKELFAYTDGGRFKMIALANDDTDKLSVEVVLTEKGKITYDGDEIGTWKMYGAGYIYIHFTDTSSIAILEKSGQDTYYGVVRPAWLEDQNRSGFTITCMSRTPVEDPEDEANNSSFALFMNSISTMVGSQLKGH